MGLFWFIAYYLGFIGSYIISSIITYLMDFYYLYPRISEEKRNTLNEIYRSVLPTVLFILTVVGMPTVYVVSLLINLLGFEFTYLKFIFDLLIMFIGADVVMYTTHRILHLPSLYIYHKVHHKITEPVGTATFYMHWIDFIFTAILPAVLPGILVSAHEVTMLMWVVLLIFNSVYISHGGFNISDKLHYYHHNKFTCNYGTGVFMDKLFGTHYEPKITSSKITSSKITSSKN
jgi:sterol desaturase/sphingolipid hydroxylase (fatty acid hydroxylase superfamily)